MTGESFPFFAFQSNGFAYEGDPHKLAELNPGTRRARRAGLGKSYNKAEANFRGETSVGCGIRVGRVPDFRYK